MTKLQSDESRKNPMSQNVDRTTPTASEVEERATPHALNSPLEVVNEYLENFYRGDFTTAGSVVAEGFAFSGPFIQVQGRAKFLESASGLREIVRGHRLLRQWSDASEVSSIYEVTFQTPLKEGTIVMSEWHVLHAGEIVSARLFFDSAAFRDLVS
jgi:hypothetical protein